VRFLSAEASRELDQETIASGTPGIVLMKRAAAAVAREAARALAARPERAARVVVLAGPGNNGGDGFEAARLLNASRTAAGIETLLLGDPDRLTGDARTTFGRLVQSGLPVRPVGSERDLEPLRNATLVVDALFGTGLTRPIAADSLAARAVALASSGRAFVVAVDVPSGLSGDRDDVPGPAVRADVTVTFGTPKRCHVYPPAAGLCGRIVVADIGHREVSPPAPGEVEVIVAADVTPLFPPRDVTSHKGTYGHLLVAGGSAGFFGAPALAARAAHRSGAGLVTVAAEECVRAAVHVLSPETTTAPSDTDLSPYDALAVGPGLGRSEMSASLLSRLVAAAKPAVFDADALNLSSGAAFFATRLSPTVLTPHPGEAGRLLGTDAASVNADRTATARRLAALSNAVVVLKGFRSVVADPDGRAALVLAGNPGMASGGTGDVLTGVIGAFLSRGLSAYDAAAAGAFLHGVAGDLAAESAGEETLIASDITGHLGAAFGLLREAQPF
jgi:NAD(P)H-hydrate epimerase